MRKFKYEIGQCVEIGIRDQQSIVIDRHFREEDEEVLYCLNGLSPSGVQIQQWFTEKELETFNPYLIFLGASNEVVDEAVKAMGEYPDWPTDPLHALAILGEEFGELTKDILQLTYEPHKTTIDNAKKEAIQTAAMAIRFISGFDQYQFKKSEKPSTDEIILGGSGI